LFCMGTHLLPGSLIAEHNLVGAVTLGDVTFTLIVRKIVRLGER
jgi:hypothetical protein